MTAAWAGVASPVCATSAPATSAGTARKRRVFTRLKGRRFGSLSTPHRSGCPDRLLVAGGVVVPVQDHPDPAVAQVEDHLAVLDRLDLSADDEPQAIDLVQHRPGRTALEVLGGDQDHLLAQAGA